MCDAFSGGRRGPSLQGAQECSIPKNCKIVRIFITIKTIEFGILICLSDKAVLLAFWRILNQGNRPNKIGIT